MLVELALVPECFIFEHFSKSHKMLVNLHLSECIMDLGVELFDLGDRWVDLDCFKKDALFHG